MTAERDPRQRVHYSLTKEGTRDVHSALEATPQKIAKRCKTSRNVRDFYLNSVDALIVLKRAIAAETVT